MRKPPLAMLLAGGILAVGSSAFANGLHEARPASPQVVYGRDDRIEYFAAPTRVQHAADAVCVVVERGELVPNGDGTVTLLTVPYANQFNPPLCDDEPFRSQSTIGECTGYLVAPDLVVTAGHCVEPDELADVAFVFGFSLTDPGQLTPAVVPEADVYYARAILGHSFHDAPDYSDYTVIRLDRVAAGRDPLAIRRTGTPVVSDPVVLIGYPYGLPLKVAGGAEVKRVTRTFFEANTDSYAANSGSPVVDSTSLVVEGMLYFGKYDYTVDDAAGCTRSRVLPDDYGSYEGCIMTRDFARFVSDGTSDPLVSLTTSVAGYDHVDLAWAASGSWLPGAQLDRRSAADDWKMLADIEADDGGRFRYQDRSVVPGQSYGYRLGWLDASGAAQTAETWVAVPLDLEFALAGARPNPAHASELQVSFTLPSAAPGELGLYDLTGRRVAATDVSAFGPGPHTVRMTSDQPTRPGVYWLRLSQGAHRASAAVVILD